MTLTIRSAETTIRAGSVGELLRLRSDFSREAAYLEYAGGGRAPAVSYGELHRMAARWAAFFKELGVGPGGTVGLVVSDPVEMAVVFLSALAAGRTVAPFDYTASDGELVAACARTAPRIVISDRSAPDGNRTKWVTMFPGECFGPGAPLYGGAMPCAGTGGVVLSTSGTTGVAKVVRLDEAQLLHAATSIADHFDLSPGDRGFNPLPLFHINAEVVGLLATLVSGGTIVLDDRFHRQGFWAAMASQGITWINAVPAILARLAVLEGGERVPAGIRLARSASAPLPVPVLERFERATGIPVVETYGMTEAASQITANPPRGPRKPGSVGVPVTAEVRVVAGEGVLALPGEVGRVGVRGPSVIRAYASPGYEDRVDADCWLDTGDLGYLDGDGYLFLVGRVDDVINRGGEKVYPKEVEDAVLGEPGVRSVAVVGRDHEVLGSVPVAYIVADGVRGEGDEQLAGAVVARVHERCTRLLARPKRPVAYHVVERLPAGPTGKVRRSGVNGVPVIFSLLVP